MDKTLGSGEEDANLGRNVTFRKDSTFTTSNTTSLDAEDKNVLDPTEAVPTQMDINKLIEEDLQSAASWGTAAKRLWDMLLSWCKKRATPQQIGRNSVLDLVQNSLFKVFISFMICGSAVQMGVAADRTGGDWDAIWRTCDFIFTAVFAVEMVLKLVALRLSYFFDGWNCLDFFVAWSSIIDVWIIPSILGTGDDAPDILKLFRLCRLLRIVKMLRVVPELMLVVEGMVASLRSMFWVFLLLGIILYTVGIYCVEAIGSEGAGYVGYDNDVGYEASVVEEFNNFLYFGTITRSMVSLFGLVLLSEWSPVVRPVWERQPATVIVFIGLVILTTFGVLNVIIGVVVERTTAAMNSVREKDVARKKRQQERAFKLISNLMFDLDVDKDKKVSKQEMEMGAENSTLHELLEKVDFPHGFTYGEFHTMLDLDGSGYLSRPEFINGMLRLVYNDQFQRDCMFQLTMGQIKANQRKLHHETKTYIQQLYNGIRKDFASLRSDLQIARPGRHATANAQNASSEGRSDGAASLGLKSLFAQSDFTSSDFAPVLVQPLRVNALSDDIIDIRPADSQRSVPDSFPVAGPSTPFSELTRLSPSLTEMNAPPRRTVLTEATEASSLSSQWEPLETPEKPVSTGTDEEAYVIGVAQQASSLHERGAQQRDGRSETPKNVGSAFEVVHEKTVDTADSPEYEACGGRILTRCSGRDGVDQRYNGIESTCTEI